jgi:hypothetical protein
MEGKSLMLRKIAIAFGWLVIAGTLVLFSRAAWLFVFEAMDTEFHNRQERMRHENTTQSLPARPQSDIQESTDLQLALFCRVDDGRYVPSSWRVPGQSCLVLPRRAKHRALTQFHTH